MWTDARRETFCVKTKSAGAPVLEWRSISGRCGLRKEGGGDGGDLVVAMSKSQNGRYNA